MKRRITYALNESASIYCNKIDKKCRAIDYAFSFDRTHLPSTKTLSSPERRTIYHKQFQPLSSIAGFQAKLPVSAEGMPLPPVSIPTTATAAPAVRIAQECGPDVDYLISDYSYGRISPSVAPQSKCIKDKVGIGSNDFLPRRGLVLLSAQKYTKADLDTKILPLLENCCNLSFDAIGSAFLTDAVMAAKKEEEKAEEEALSRETKNMQKKKVSYLFKFESGEAKLVNANRNSYEGKVRARQSTTAISWHILFFVRDDSLLQIERSGVVGNEIHAEGYHLKTADQLREPGVGALMSSNLRFLETLQGAIQVYKFVSLLSLVSAYRYVGKHVVHIHHEIIRPLQVLRKYNPPKVLPVRVVLPDDVATSIPPDYFASGVSASALLIPNGSLPEVSSE